MRMVLIHTEMERSGWINGLNNKGEGNEDKLSRLCIKGEKMMCASILRNLPSSTPPLPSLIQTPFLLT